MGKRVATNSDDAPHKLSLAEAAGQLGLQRRQLKTWRSRFAMFASRGDRVCAQDLYAFRALKALLLDHGYDEAHVLRLLEEEGAQAVIAAYSARHVRPQTNPAHALQHAVRSAAAAGFFGEVYAEVDDDTPADLTGARPASYAQARLARLK